MTRQQPVRVAIMESEKGWGSRIDEIKNFNCPTKAQQFVDDFNSENNLDVVPDWYMYAEILED